ncbi:histidine kinase [Cellulomonas hominis]
MTLPPAASPPPDPRTRSDGPVPPAPPYPVPWTGHVPAPGQMAGPGQVFGPGQVRGPMPAPAGRPPLPSPPAQQPFPVAPGAHQPTPTAAPYWRLVRPVAAQPWQRPPRMRAPVLASRRLRSALSTTWVVTVAIFASSVAVAYASPTNLDNAAPDAWAVLGWLWAAGTGALLVKRREWPALVTTLACVGALVFPLDTVGAMIAYSWVVSRETARRRVWLGALLVVATGVALARDLSGPATSQVLSSTSEDGVVTVWPWWAAVVLAVGALALSVGVGWYRRTQATVGELRTLSDDRAAETRELHGELVRRAERELIAREVHDTLASRLSLVSLHAGALELAAADAEPDLRDAAQAVRANAHRSLEDLRDLVELLHDPDELARRVASQSMSSATTLTSLGELLAATRAAGTRLVSLVLVDDAGRASAPLSAATFRILQESLTNVHKHAPGSEVDIDVHGGPGTGLFLRVSNPLPTTPPVDPVPGSGSGVRGIHERARLLGGTATVGEQDGRYVVEAWLPWSGDDGSTLVAASHP